MNFRSISVLLCIFGTLIVSPPAFGQEIGNGNSCACLQEGSVNASECENAQHRLMSQVKLLKIESVNDGRLHTSILTTDDLISGKPIELEGYACGLVAFCDEVISVSVNDRPLDRIRQNSDGLAFINGMGLSNVEPIPSLLAGTAFHSNGYSLFPAVRGESLFSKESFEISFGNDAETYTSIVRQGSSHSVRDFDLDSGIRRARVTFRYLGKEPEQLRNICADFDERHRAIAEGIDSVESALDIDLVSTVTIIDFEDLHDAVACDGQTDIWLYADAFLKEPIEELRTIAAHESLHIYVDKSRLTRDSEVREFFADLMGYDELSHDRLRLVTGGIVPKGTQGSGFGGDIFFDVIDEKNLLEGMKGGHSRTDMAEFCTSFMHSLMFIDRLEENLGRPLHVLDSPGQPRPLTVLERDSVLQNYIKGIDIFEQALPSKQEVASSEAKRILKDRLEKIRRIRQRQGPAG